MWWSKTRFWRKKGCSWPLLRKIWYSETARPFPLSLGTRGITVKVEGICERQWLGFRGPSGEDPRTSKLLTWTLWLWDNSLETGLCGNIQAPATNLELCPLCVIYLLNRLNNLERLLWEFLLASRLLRDFPTIKVSHPLARSLSSERWVTGSLEVCLRSST